MQVAAAISEDITEETSQERLLSKRYRKHSVSSGCSERGKQGMKMYNENWQTQKK